MKLKYKGEKVCIDGVMYCPATYINAVHKTKYKINCILEEAPVEKYNTADPSIVKVIAIKDIAKDTELLCDYGNKYF